jgi:predicted RNase H-like HicB family nuclease
MEVAPGMVKSYTAKYTKISSGYMGQLIEWPEVVIEGKNIEECRKMLRDSLAEMILVYKQHGREIPLGGDLLGQVPVEVSFDC